MAGNQRFHPYQNAGNQGKINTNSNSGVNQTDNGPGFNVFAHFFPELYAGPGAQPRRPEVRGKKARGKKTGNFPGSELDIKVSGLPKKYAMGELKKVFAKLEVNAKIKPTGRFRQRFSPSWVFLHFETVEEKEKGILVLHGYRWKNSTFHVSGEMPMNRPVVNYIKTMKKLSLPQRVIKSEFESSEEAVKYTHLPLWDVPYEEQLSEKTEKAKSTLKALASEMLIEEEKKFRPVVPELVEFAKKQTQEYDGLPCEFVGVLPAPRTEGYRQRCEFTIGLDENGTKVVGFEVKHPKDQRTIAPIPPSLTSLPQKMKETVWTFQKFVQASSVDIYNYKTNTGNLRLLSVRTGLTSNKTLITVHLHPQEFSEEQIEAFKIDLVGFYTQREGKQCPPSGIYVQFFTRRNLVWDKATLTHVFGDKSIVEKACGRTFELTPPASFLINLSLADLIYKNVAELARVDKATTLIEIYREVGLAGLVLAQRAGEVLGLDVSAADDTKATETAKRNNITNCRHFFGPTDVQLPTVLADVKLSKIVAIIEAPRTGLQPLVISYLRQAEKLNRIVFMSNHPFGVFQNLNSLCHPTTKTTPGQPFVPVKAVAIDFLPHTFSYKFMVAFERLATSPAN